MVAPPAKTKWVCYKSTPVSLSVLEQQQSPTSDMGFHSIGGRTLRLVTTDGDTVRVGWKSLKIDGPTKARPAIKAGAYGFYKTYPVGESRV